MGGPRIPANEDLMPQRLWFNIEPGRSDDECWLWLGSKSTDGYGQLRIDGASRNAHCVAYELEVGAIPEGMELDHTCRARACINPRHLEPVTHQVNMERSPFGAAKTRCKNGHPLTGPEASVRTDSKGHRFCRACKREYEQAQRDRLKALP